MQDVSNVLKARRLKCLTKTFERQLSVRKSPRMDEFLNVSQSARSLKKIQAIICQKSQFGKLFKTGEFGFKKEPSIELYGNCKFSPNSPANTPLISS